MMLKEHSEGCEGCLFNMRVCYVPDGTHTYTHLIYMVLQAQSGTTYREVGSTQTSLGVMSPIPWCCCI